MEVWPKKWNAGLMEVENMALKTEGGTVSWRIKVQGRGCWLKGGKMDGGTKVERLDGRRDRILAKKGTRWKERGLMYLYRTSWRDEKGKITQKGCSASG